MFWVTLEQVEFGSNDHVVNGFRAASFADVVLEGELQVLEAQDLTHIQLEVSGNHKRGELTEQWWHVISFNAQGPGLGRNYKVEQTYQLANTRLGSL